MDNRVEKTAVLTAVGDLQVTHPFLEVMVNGGEPYREVLSFLKDADLTLANLEVVLAAGGHPVEKMIVLRSNPGLIGEISQLGLDVVTLANNHAMDFGYEALGEMMALLDQHRISHVGAGGNLGEAMRPIILERQGVRVAFFGLASTLAHGCGASPERPGIAPIRVRTAYEIDTSLLEEQPGTPPMVHTYLSEDDTSFAAARIRETRERCDAAVVGVHWGVAFDPSPADYQRKLGRALIDAGADLIVGHHPHTLQPIEIYRDRCIFYSIANFLFHFEIPADVAEQAPGDNPWQMSPESLLVQAKITPGGVPAITLVPLEVDACGHPKCASQSKAEDIFAHLDKISHKFNCCIEREPGNVRGRPVPLSS